MNDAGGPLRLGDVVLTRAAATPEAGAPWRQLRRVCPAADASDAATVARQAIVALDGPLLRHRLPPALAPLVDEVLRLNSVDARARLIAAGFECASLYWGAWSPPIDGEAIVLWRSDAGAVSARADAVALPLYPVVRAHAARGEPVLHAAAVAGRARAVLLLGPSGAGKSTAARQAGSAGARALCDDAALVTHDADGAPAVVPLPSAAAVAADAVPLVPSRTPLAALCFLAHAPHDRLRPLDPLQATQRLVQSCLVEVGSACSLPAPARTRLFHALHALAARVPAFVLELRPRPDFFALLTAQLGLDG
jgi:hypothetical protein